MFTIEASPEYARIVAKSWINPKFRERLIADPASVLTEHGIDIPAGLQFRLTPGGVTSRLELALPPMPHLTDEPLGRHAGGPPKKTKAEDAAEPKPDKASDDPGFSRRCRAEEPAAQCKPTKGKDDAVASTKPCKGYEAGGFPPKPTKGEDIGTSLTRGCYAGSAPPASA